MTIVRSRRELVGLPVSAAVTTRGKELATTDTVAKARRLFAHGSVRVLPILDGTAYVGALERDSLRDDLCPETPVAAIASQALQTALAGTPSAQALAQLDRTGASRLVVLDDDGVTYRGLVCLRSDRRRVCVDAECHAENATQIEEGTYA
jgi:CBS domain-containing protein